MTVKLIAIDIDDTLLNDALLITPRVKRAVQNAVDKGVYVVLCTGRIRKGAVRFYEELSLDTPMIVSGGAEIFDAQGHLMYSHPVDPALVKKLLQYAYDRGIHAQVYINGELVYRESNAYSRHYESLLGHPGIEMPDIMSLETIITPKVLYVMEPDMVEETQRETKKFFPGLTIASSKPDYLEFASADVSKGEALAFLADHYKLERQSIIAVGDSQIDISMIRFAGIGIAMANAARDVKESADVICPSNEDDGIAYVIEKYILEAAHES